MIRIAIALAVLSTTSFARQDDADHPVRHDRTGIAWQIPFDEARSRALESKRLLAIKPVAFGTTRDGCW